MKINSIIKTIGLSCTLAAVPLTSKAFTNQYIKQDKFTKNNIKPQGTLDENILIGAPSPFVNICGEEKNAKIVVDLSKNILYKYNDLGKAEIAYSVASGKKSSPTHKGVRIVTHIETFPYRTAPRQTKRRRNPSAYGPKIICLNKLDPITGEQSSTGEFIHGNDNAESIGKYISHGCIRMDNDIIKLLSTQVKRGDIVIIK